MLTTFFLIYALGCLCPVITAAEKHVTVNNNITVTDTQKISQKGKGAMANQLATDKPKEDDKLDQLLKDDGNSMLRFFCCCFMRAHMK